MISWVLWAHREDLGNDILAVMTDRDVKATNGSVFPGVSWMIFERRFAACTAFAQTSVCQLFPCGPNDGIKCLVSGLLHSPARCRVG